MKVDHHFVGHFYSPERLLPPPLHWPRTQPGKEDVSSRSENFWWRMDGEDELDSVGPRRKRKKPIVVESAGSRGIWGTVPGYEYQPDIHQCQPGCLSFLDTSSLSFISFLCFPAQFKRCFNDQISGLEPMAMVAFL
mmetsp:Transcript_76213/g.204687  ORF Transcript_76213/g.204687 Transcript_76213/m.204687 type:complete len:136 (-) Transcript_76213:949-1356(-)